MRMDSDAIGKYMSLLKEGSVIDYSIRILIVGHTGVGKTALTRRLLGDKAPLDVKTGDITDGIEVHVNRCTVPLNDDQKKWKLLPSGEMNIGPSVRLATLFTSPVKSATTREQVTIEQECEQWPHPTASFDGPKAQAETSYLEQDAADTAAYTKGRDDLQTFVEELRRSKKLETSDHVVISIWDFAGHLIYYHTHQIFLSSRAVYLLVTDVSKDLQNPVTQDVCYPDSNGEKHVTTSEFVDFWMNSIYFHTANSDTKPATLLVGTHMDVLKKNDPYKRDRKTLAKAYFQGVRQHLKGKLTSKYLEDDIFDIDIDNTDPNDPNYDYLRASILDVAFKEDSKGVLIPAKWLRLEEALMKRKAQGIKILSRSEIIVLNSEMLVPIPDEAGLELFMRYHHEAGNFIYFSDAGLREKVVLDPSWLADAFKAIITAKPSMNPKDVDEDGDFRELQKTGMLRPDLLVEIWQRHADESFAKNHNHILTLMEKLNLVARLRMLETGESDYDEEDFFFVPCMLKDPPPEHVLRPENSETAKSTPVLCFSFVQKLLPLIVFHRLLAVCLGKWTLCRNKRKLLIFRGCCIFRCVGHKITMMLKEHSVLVWLTSSNHPPKVKECIEVREFLENCVRHTTGSFSSKKDYEVRFLCPECSNTVVNVNTGMFDSLGNKTGKCTHDVMPEDILKYWYKSVQEGVQDIGSLKVLQKPISGQKQSAVFEGQFGDVVVAIKVIPLPQTNEDLKEHVIAYRKQLREVEILRKAPDRKHPNIVGFYHSEETNTALYIAMELCQGTLEDYYTKPYCDKLDRKKVLQQVSFGMEFLHEIDIVHRDLKPSNVLIKDTMYETKAVISDFGSSKVTQDGECSLSGPIGTRGWIAPEVCAFLLSAVSQEEGKWSYTTESDVWSLGCLFHFVVTGKRPLDEDKENEEKSDPRDEEHLRPLISAMRSREPCNRPNCKTIRQSPLLLDDIEVLNFFQEVNNHVELSSSHLEDSKNQNWLTCLPAGTGNYLINYRYLKGTRPTYQGHETEIRYLVKAIRDCNVHFRDLPKHVQKEVGDSCKDQVRFWLSIFPDLLPHVYGRMHSDQDFMEKWSKQGHGNL